MATKKAKKAKKTRPFDLHTFLVGKLRSATRRCPPFNAVQAEAKIKVLSEYIEKPDGTKWLKVVINEEKFGYSVGDELWIRVYKKLPSCDRVMFLCAACRKLFLSHEYLPKKKGGGLKKTSMTAIDHVDPVVGVEGFVDWNLYISRMFEGALQILCNYSGERDGVQSCHHIKTKQEQEARQAVKSLKAKL